MGVGGLFGTKASPCRPPPLARCAYLPPLPRMEERGGIPRGRRPSPEMSDGRMSSAEGEVGGSGGNKKD